jgi:hypothetical protein
MDCGAGTTNRLTVAGHQFHLVRRFRQRKKMESAFPQPPLAAPRPGGAESALGIVENGSAFFISYFCNYRIHGSKKFSP